MISKPTLIINRKTCQSNIQRMNLKAKKHKLIFRPHFKTHQLTDVGEWFKKEGIERITVSSVDMAAYFSKHGWKDITIAFPVNILEIDSINRIAIHSKLNLLVESIETIDYLGKHLNSSSKIFIKIDLGYHRTGVLWDNKPEIKALINRINGSTKLNFTGFLIHGGDTYMAENKEDVLDIHNASLEKIKKLKENFPEGMISYGDTPSCSISDVFTGVDEIRPGNFIFYDLMQLTIGSCDLKDIAAIMYCPVVAKHPKRLEVIMYGGAVHFSKDFLRGSNGNYYGLLLAKHNGDSLQEIKGFISKLSQEHGTIKVEKEFFDQINIGDILSIIPVHSCLTMDLMKHKSYQII